MLLNKEADITFAHSSPQILSTNMSVQLVTCTY